MVKAERDPCTDVLPVPAMQGAMDRGCRIPIHDTFWPGVSWCLLLTRMANG